MTVIQGKNFQRICGWNNNSGFAVLGTNWNPEPQAGYIPLPSENGFDAFRIQLIRGPFSKSGEALKDPKGSRPRPKMTP
jgi:hypothetical protein